MSDSDIARDLRRSLRLLTVTVLAVAAGLVVVFAVSWRSANDARRSLQREEVRTNAALCSLRGDLKRRVSTSEAFLVAHPHGIPGITAAQIQSGISSETRSVHALSLLRCADPND